MSQSTDLHRRPSSDVAQDITCLDAVALSQAIHQRRLSCQAVMDAYLTRIDAHNPTLNAILYLRPRAELMAEARAADAELDVGSSRGWMHGFPHAVKDLSEAAGLPTSWGSRLYTDYRSTVDAVHVARIRQAGAIFIGKTNTPEFGLGSHTTNPVHGPTRNPWDITKSAGGSSGGAGAALAARLVPIADGSDMMGSLRNPAAFNGVIGFRPSTGRVPSGKGVEAFMGPLGTAGPMGRSVRDVARLLATQAGYMANDPWSLADEDLTLGAPIATRGLKIAWFGDFGGALRFDPGVLDVDRNALATFANMGCDVHEIIPDFDMKALWEAWLVLRAFNVIPGMKALYSDPGKLRLAGPQVHFEKDIALETSAIALFDASKVRTQWFNYLCNLFKTFDYIVMPSAQVFPFDVNLPWVPSLGGVPTDTYHRWMEVVIGPTLAGLPVAAVPAGVGASGLPNGVQLVGPPRADRATLEFAQAYETAVINERGALVMPPPNYA